MIDSRPLTFAVGFILLICLARPTYAFGAGNIAAISKIEGQNWRHGDIEDALLKIAMARAIGGKKFNKLSVSRVYFGNWLRDYSQAIDVGTVKSVSAEAIRLLLCVLGFMTFGYGSSEFEVTAYRLGCYRPEDHIDNPKNYADNEDAQQYDRRLRAPIDEETELAVDPETGMKNYIANESAGIMTSAQHCRKLFGECIELGRKYGRDGDEADLHESLRLLGTGLHCLEDFYAHSNYTELALIEMGERDVFPHVGRDTRINLEGARGEVYPLVTGTFGGVDFLHSVTGEVSDKLTQNEIEELEDSLKHSASADTSILRNLLDMVPDGIFGGDHQSDKMDEIQSNATSSQLQNMSVSPRDPEEFTIYVKQIFDQIMPAIEWHDNVMKSISGAIEKIPVLPKIMEQLEEQLSKFVFSIIAPFIVPVISQIRGELKTGSDEIIESSQKEQHIVFHDDDCTDPTHSMLSKDHFSNILNEVAGRCAAYMLRWVVPQVMEAMDDDSIDVDRLLTRIIYGVMHHPAQRDMGRDGIQEGRATIFRCVEDWWNEMDGDKQDDYRSKLSRRGVQNAENHKEGVHDTGHGHGCVGKLKMRKMFGESETWEDKLADKAAGAILEGASGAFSGMIKNQTGLDVPTYDHPEQRQSGGGDEGGMGGLLGKAAGSLLSGAFGGDNTESHSSSRRRDDGGYTESRTEYGRSGDRYEQAQYSETSYGDGSRRAEYSRYQQEDQYGGQQAQGYGYEERYEQRRTDDGSYEEHSSRRRYEGHTEDSGYGQSQSGHHGRRDDEEQYGHHGRRDDEEQYGHHRRHEDEGHHGHRHHEDEGHHGHHRRRDEEEGRGGEGLGGFLDTIRRGAEDAFGGDSGRRGW